MDINLVIESERKIIEKFIDRVFWIHKVHYIYEQLYGNDIGEKILKGTAPFFFDDLSEILIDYLLLEFSKITDPAITKGESNLTTNYIVEKIDWEKEDREKLSQYNEELKSFTAYFKDARNKLLAHFDLKVSINDNIKSLGGFPKGADKEFLHVLWGFCNYASVKKNSQFLGDINLANGDGTLDLIHALRKGLAYDKLFEEGSLEEKIKLFEYKQKASD